jgi:hypothetical protein
VRLRRGIKARGNCLAGRHEVGGQAARGGRKKVTGVGWHGGEDTSDKRGPVVRETRERRPAQEGVNKMGWLGQFRPAGTARPLGWLGQRPNGQRGWPGRKQGKMISELKIGFLNLPRLWKFVEGDLGGILT